MRIPRRAEVSTPSALVETFVDVGPLATLLSSFDHQILYGRRGTGKTHALKYLREKVSGSGDLGIYIDMQKIGSTGGVYGDPTIPVPERATRLLMDTLGVVHDELAMFVLDLSMRDDPGLSDVAFSLLDQLAREITRVRVVGDVEYEQRQREETRTGSDAKVDAGIRGGVPQGSIGVALSGRSESANETRFLERGAMQHTVHFGAAHRALQAIVDELPINRLWVLVDEWSDVPLDLQPLLADLLRRTLFTVNGLTVKIGAIEHRARFRAAHTSGGHIGIEVGSDAAAGLDLDDFMVFHVEPARAKRFFAELLFKHVRVLSRNTRSGKAFASREHVVSLAFGTDQAFEEYVRAAEGVPRDAINIASQAAQLAGDEQITLKIVRTAAHRWYERDKHAAIVANGEARSLLHWVIDRVVRERQARGFILLQGDQSEHPLVAALYDARVLHILKKGVASKNEPGVRYDAYVLDYGCYVDLLTTRETRPLSLLGATRTAKAAENVKVPREDLELVRRAILDLDEFEQSS